MLAGSDDDYALLAEDSLAGDSDDGFGGGRLSRGGSGSGWVWVWEDKGEGGVWGERSKKLLSAFDCYVHAVLRARQAGPVPLSTPDPAPPFFTRSMLTLYPSTANDSVLPEGTHLFLSRYFPSPKTYMAMLGLTLGTLLAVLAFFLAAGSGTGAGGIVAMLVIFGLGLGGGWYIVMGWHRDELQDYHAGVR